MESDRPQRGRFQEFTQCDVDAIGSNSILLEYEMIQIYSRVFRGRFERCENQN